MAGFVIKRLFSNGRVLLAGLACTAIAGASHAALTEGLELYYNFDEDTIAAGGVFDQSANGRTGSPNLDNGSLSISGDVAGAIGGGSSLANTGSDWLESLWTGVSGSTDRTVSFWVKKDPGVIATQSVLVEWGTNTTGNRYTITQEISTSEGGGSTQGGVRTEIQSDYRTTPTGGPVITDGTWNHVAIVYDSGVAGSSLNSVTMYVNGTALGSYADNANTPTLSTTLAGGVTIAGGPLNGTNRYTVGNMDEVGIWSRALSASEVGELAGGTSFNLIAGTNFDDTVKSGSSQTMTGIDWESDSLVTANTSVTTTASNNDGYFTTGFGATGFAPDQNIENEGPWSAIFEITLDAGASGVIEMVAFDYAALTNSGTSQGTNFRAQQFDVLVNGVAFDVQQLTTAVNGALAFEDSAVLNAGLNTIEIISSDVSGPGYNMAIDDLRFFGSVVPEPTSLALLGLGGLMVARRRRG